MEKQFGDEFITSEKIINSNDLLISQLMNLSANLKNADMTNFDALESEFELIKVQINAVEENIEEAIEDAKRYCECKSGEEIQHFENDEEGCIQCVKQTGINSYEDHVA